MKKFVNHVHTSASRCLLFNLVPDLRVKLTPRICLFTISEACITLYFLLILHGGACQCPIGDIFDEQRLKIAAGKSLVISQIPWPIVWT